MNQTAESFFHHSKSIAEKFLTTALIVDDRAKFGATDTPHPEIDDPTYKDSSQRHPTPTAEIADTEPKPLKPAKTRKSKGRNHSESEEPAPDTKDTDIHTEKEGPSHELDAKKVIQSFADKQIVCSVIKPELADYDSLNKTISNLGQSTDLIVFDWQLFDGSGDKTLELITETVQASNDHTPQQLRLISVYTGEHDINDIAEKINRALKEIKGNDEVKTYKNGLIQIVGSCRVIVLVKENATETDQNREVRVGFINLADRLVVEFTKMTSGLLSNVAMESFSLVKQNTHKIIRKFSPDLDYPYLTHRICLEHPEDAECLAESLVTKEFESIIHEFSVGQKANKNRIREWVKLKIGAGHKFKFKDNDMSEDSLADLVEHGSNSFPNYQISKSTGYQDLTRMFSANSQNPGDLDLKFAKMVTVQTYYSGNSPVLSLGTIIKSTDDKDEEKYLICIQPRCDCVRLNEFTPFPFLPLLDTQDKNCIHVVVPIKDDKLKRLLISKKPSLLKLITFRAHLTSKKIIAERQYMGKFAFECVDGCKYEWIGELKQEFAQNVANSFSTEIARVGTDNSEWLRRWEQKEQK